MQCMLCKSVGLVLNGEENDDGKTISTLISIINFDRTTKLNGNIRCISFDFERFREEKKWNDPKNEDNERNKTAI